MDGNWGGFSDPDASAFKGHLGLQLFHQPYHPHSSLQPPTTNPRVGGFGCYSEVHTPLDYMREAWLSQNREKYPNVAANVSENREKYLNILADNHNHVTSYGAFPASSSAHTGNAEMIQQSSFVDLNDDVCPLVYENCEVDKKRGSDKLPKCPKAKKPKRAEKSPVEDCVQLLPHPKAPKKTAEVVINGMNMEISGIPIPVCTCTGTAQNCYRWGAGGWQSACCTTSMSVYPLPMSTKRRGARIAGRKMSIGAFRKVLEKLASEGFDFENPIDLKNHWAKHGTNKFVTIR